MKSAAEKRVRDLVRLAEANPQMDVAELPLSRDDTHILVPELLALVGRRGPMSRLQRKTATALSWVAAFQVVILLSFRSLLSVVLAFFGVLTVFLIIAERGARASKYDRTLARIVAHWGDARAIGALAQAAAIPGMERQLILTALQELMSRFDLADAKLLDARDREALFDLLRERPHLSVQQLTSLLTIVEELRDPAALDRVESLAAELVETQASARLTEAAFHCLGVLREAAATAEQSTTLLHPAQRPQHEALLRPSRSIQTDEAVLLRVEADREAQ